jgi:hypothetical protein
VARVGVGRVRDRDAGNCDRNSRSRNAHTQVPDESAHGCRAERNPSPRSGGNDAFANHTPVTNGHVDFDGHTHRGRDSHAHRDAHCHHRANGHQRADGDAARRDGHSRGDGRDPPDRIGLNSRHRVRRRQR